MARGADCEENGEAARTRARGDSDSERMIYFDNNATTQVDPAVLEVMLPFLQEQYGNPSSAYSFGKRTAKAVNTAREQVAALLRCDPAEIIFTSCGTESDNTAIQSALLLDPDRKHLVTSKVEHSAIIKHAEALARRGYEVTWLDVDSEGMLDLNALERAIREETAVVSLMWANNETGALFPIEEAAAICRSKGTLFHTDAVQAVGKIDINLSKLPINFLSLSGHKLHAPKGVAALYVNRKTRFNPYLIGGGQESKRRGGTCRCGAAGREQPRQSAPRPLRTESCGLGLMRSGEWPSGVSASEYIKSRNRGPRFRRNAAAAGPERNLLFGRIGMHRRLIGTVTRPEGDGVFERPRGSLRFSFSRFNTEAEVDLSLQIIPTAIERLRSLTRGVLAA